MNKYGLIFLFLLLAASVFGQKKASKVNLISSTSIEGVPAANGKKIYNVHNGVFQQDFSVIRSDSSLFYPDLNMVDFFGHVVINQGDTLHVYSDLLNYNGNTKVAVLTNHVIMVDKDATLTTNHFTYNTATRIGIYTEGGKLVNKDNTLISKNGYYFAFTRDEYFRYNVVCTTPDAIIKTDTLRYNSGSRIAYFYGPTHIYGTKDKDTLYTENGTYNTSTEQAFFGKKNLYSQGTKTLKGDSLFYDRLKGYGRATKHVIFNDNEQKATARGDLGEYYKAADSMVMTQNPYMIFVTEDTTAAKPGDKSPAPDSLLKPVNKETIAQKMDAVAKNNPVNKGLTLKGITDSVTKKMPVKINPPGKKMTLQGITDSVIKKPPPQAKTKTRPATAKTQSIAENAPVAVDTVNLKALAKKPGNVKYDSIYFVADTIKTQVLTYKDLKALLERRYQADHRDTSIKVKKIVPIVYKKAPKFLSLDPPGWPVDTSFIHHDFFGKPKPAPVKVTPKIVKVVDKKKAIQDSIMKRKADSIALTKPKGLSDTARVRIITGYHHSKLFKSDLQAKSDSMFYSSSDSTIRCYVNPMIWTQGSQLSGDTINLQMKNKKLDNMDMYPAAFIVNIEKDDSVHFNQLGGRKMHGTFKNSKLNTMDITGNAETIFFKRDSVKNTVTDMIRTVSDKIHVLFKNGNMANNSEVGNYEAKLTPIDKVKEEDKILKAFIWKPKERPVSKESILSAYHPKPVVSKKTTAKGGPDAKKTGKPELKKPGTINTGKDTIAKPPSIKMTKDSAAKDTGKVKGAATKLPAIKMTRDSTVKDTGKVKGPATKPPAIKNK